MAYTFEPHYWIPFRGVGRERCTKCGLIALRNKFSEFCIKHGCNHVDHSRYKHERDHCG